MSKCISLWLVGRGGKQHDKGRGLSKAHFIPHAHFDHVCGVPGLKEAFPHLQVLASGPAAKVLGKEKVVTGFFNEDRVFIENLQKKKRGAESITPGTTTGGSANSAL